jgi:two-component system chemotaxis response regulator CheY
MKKETDVLTVHEIGKDGSETVKKYKINDDGTLGRKLSSVKKAIRYARENAMTVLPHGQCVPYAVFNGGCNDNIAAIAGSGRGKTRTLVEPNILAAASSMIISDPKGYLYKKYKDILEKNGYEVAGEAKDGKEAVAVYKEKQPALVLLDITMPEMDGIAALKQIMEYDSSAKVIMCSALGQSNMVIESIQIGAKDYIVKPFQADRVLEAVRKILG